MKIDILPQDVPLLLPDGRITPAWYEVLKLLCEKRNLGDLVDVDASGIANTEVLAYNSTTGNYEPAAN